MAHKKRRDKRDDPRKRKDPLIGPGGKVDRAALYHAGQAGQRTQSSQAAQAGEPQKQVSPTPSSADELAEELSLDDEELATGGSGLPSSPGTSVHVNREIDAPIEGATRGTSASGRQTITFTLQRDLDKRLDKYLVDRITFLSRSKLQALIEAGDVKVNGKPAKASTNLRLDDVVEVMLEMPSVEPLPAQDIPISVLFEDEHMLVLNKSPDIIVHPARSHLSGTLINAVAFYLRHRSPFGGGLSAVGSQFARPGVVHRLDRQTSGVIVMAKSDTAHWQLGLQFEKRQTDKRYVALVHGKVEPNIDVIDEPIGPHPSREKGHREKHVVRHDHLGKESVTIYRVLARFRLPDTPARGASAELAKVNKPEPEKLSGKRTPIPPAVKSKARGWGSTPASNEPLAALTDSASGFVGVKRDDLSGISAASFEVDDGDVHLGPQSPWVSLVEVELKTGRTHQIRVHMSHRLHPLVADDLYGGRLMHELGFGRVALHAAMLTLRHPMSSQAVRFIAPLPDDLAKPLRAMVAQGSKSKGADNGAKVEIFENVPGAVLSVRQLLGLA